MTVLPMFFDVDIDISDVDIWKMILVGYNHCQQHHIGNMLTVNGYGDDPRPLHKIPAWPGARYDRAWPWGHTLLSTGRCLGREDNYQGAMGSVHGWKEIAQTIGHKSHLFSVPKPVYLKIIDFSSYLTP